MKPAALASILLVSLFIGAQQPSNQIARISIPGVKGVLQIEVGPAGFQTRVRPDGQEVQLRALQRADGLAITAFLQRVNFEATAEKCRTEWWSGTKNSVQVQRDDMHESFDNGIATVEYVIPEFRGIKVQQKNVHAYIGVRNLCAEIHLSKASFQPRDETLFQEVLRSAKLQADSAVASESDNADNPGNPDASFYFREGSKLYLQQNYVAAAEIYEKALGLEKNKRTLSQAYFRVLVDNLGMSYGISGNLAKAKTTLEYGLSQDPEYPMFFYNMACVYGEQGSMREAIAQLRLAYKYKANSIPGEGIPDPLKDDSFRYIVDNKTFVDAVREMQK